MKKYKLLKDSYDAELGTVFEKINKIEYAFKSKTSGTCTVTIDVVENNPEWFEEVEPEWKKWEPEIGEIYYFISGLFDEVRSVTKSDAYKEGDMNYFETREQAEWILERIKLLIEMKEFADVCNESSFKSVGMHYISYDKTNTILLALMGCRNDSLLTPYFNSKSDCEKAIEIFGHRIKALKP